MYFAEIHWWDEYQEDEVVDYAFVCATNYADAMQHIDSAFDHITQVMLEEFDSEKRNLVYIPKECVDQTKEINIW